MLAHKEKDQQCCQQVKEDEWLKFCKHCQKKKNKMMEWNFANNVATCSKKMRD